MATAGFDALAGIPGRNPTGTAGGPAAPPPQAPVQQQQRQVVRYGEQKGEQKQAQCRPSRLYPNVRQSRGYRYTNQDVPQCQAAIPVSFQTRASYWRRCINRTRPAGQYCPIHARLSAQDKEYFVTWAEVEECKIPFQQDLGDYNSGDLGQVATITDANIGAAINDVMFAVNNFTSDTTRLQEELKALQRNIQNNTEATAQVKGNLTETLQRAEAAEARANQLQEQLTQSTGNTQDLQQRLQQAELVAQSNVDTARALAARTNLTIQNNVPPFVSKAVFDAGLPYVTTTNNSNAVWNTLKGLFLVANVQLLPGHFLQDGKQFGFPLQVPQAILQSLPANLRVQDQKGNIVPGLNLTAPEVHAGPGSVPFDDAILGVKLAMNFFIYLMAEPVKIGVPQYFQQAIQASNGVPPTTGAYGLFSGVAQQPTQVTAAVNSKLQNYASLLAFPEKLRTLPAAVARGFFVQGFNVLLRLLQLTTTRFLATISPALARGLQQNSVQSYVDFYYAAVVALGISTLCSAFYASASRSVYASELKAVGESFVASVDDLAALVVRLFLVSSGKERGAQPRVRAQLSRVAIRQAAGYLNDLGQQATLAYQNGQYIPLLTFNDNQAQQGKQFKPQLGIGSQVLRPSSVVTPNDVPGQGPQPIVPDN